MESLTAAQAMFIAAAIVMNGLFVAAAIFLVQRDLSDRPETARRGPLVAGRRVGALAAGWPLNGRR